MNQPEHTAPKQADDIRWRRLFLGFGGMLIISFGLAYLLQNILGKSSLPMYRMAWLTYASMFGISLLANLSVMVPVPFAASLMVAAATKWDPVLVALAAALGGSIGELSGYYAGYLGKKLAISGEIPGYRRIERWIQRWGVWAVFFLALQPIIPFDIGGFIAGAARMPIRKFLPILFLGKFPKYLLLTYAGLGIINFLPFLRSYLQ